MKPITIHGAPEGFDALLVARRRAEVDGPIAHVCRDDARMARMADALGFFAPEIEVLRFPAWDCLPYDRVSPNPEIIAERVATLTRLLEAPKRPRVLLTTVNALVQKVPPPAVFEGATLSLAKGGRIQPEKLTEFLEANGYHRTGTVMEHGEYAVRGGIVDLYPAGEPEPLRLDFFGDEIEDMRRFDTASQRSGKVVPALSLRPVGEVFLDEASRARFRGAYRELFGAAAADDPLYGAISAGRRHPGMEHWAGLFHEAMVPLLAYLPDTEISFDHQAEEVLKARFEMITDHYEARRVPSRIGDGDVPYRPAPPATLYQDEAGWAEMLTDCRVLRFSPFAQPEGIAAGGRPGPLFAEARSAGENVFAAYAAMVQGEAKAKRRPVLAAWSRGSRERLGNLLRENGVKAEAAEDWKAARALPPDVVALVVMGIERGFIAEGIAVTAEQDLLGERIARPPRRRRRADQFIADAT